MSEILVIAEFIDGKPAAPTLELVGEARRQAGSTGGVTVLAMGVDPAAAATLIPYGADRVWHWGEANRIAYDSDEWTACAEHVARLCGAALVLTTHNSRGADLAPRLAFRLGGSIATGCIVATLSPDAVTVSRPCYGGNARATLTLARLPAIVSMRGGAVDAIQPDAERRGDVGVLAFVPPPARSRVIERHRDAEGAVRLEDARVVVAGGRGLDGPEGFEILRGLAETLGAAVGASRVPCDLGWCPHSMQIGLTGKTVTPELYVAVGISGAGHHLAGCGGARTIVAINTDGEAPIFRQARFGVVGDYRELVPALTLAITRSRGG